MKKFNADELRTFLKAVDANLDQDAQITIIGGAAFALAYNDSYRTHDIDTWASFSRDVKEAAEKAKSETGLKIEFGPARVPDAPYEAECRAIPILPELKHLKLQVFDEHDLVLSKTVRGFNKDFQAIKKAHKKHPYKIEILIDRYTNEMTHCIGRPSSLWFNFIELIQVLYGSKMAKRVARLIPKPEP